MDQDFITTAVSDKTCIFRALNMNYVIVECGAKGVRKKNFLFTFVAGVPLAATIADDKMYVSCLQNPENRDKKKRSNSPTFRDLMTQ